jgi:hypothetical protein
MKSPMLQILAIATALLFAGSSVAAEKTLSGVSGDTATAAGKASARSTYPFRGEVESVESDHLLLARKDGTRRVVIASESQFDRDGKSIAASEVKPGDYVKGLLRKDGSGTEVVVKASAGVRPEKGSSKKTKKNS